MDKHYSLADNSPKTNQTTRPPRDPGGEQGNKCLALKMRTFPRASERTSNVEFPIPFAQETEELPGSNVVSDPAYYSFLLAFQARGGGKE